MKLNEGLDKMLEYYCGPGAFLTSKAGKDVNTMTVSWGMVGRLWNKPVFMAFVRPQRFTNGILQRAGSFTVSVPYGTLAQELTVCGTKSGADIDKSAVVSFIPAKSVDSPVVDGCDMYYECKIIYRDKIDGSAVPEEIRQAQYPKDDFHYVYLGEIVECYN